MKIAYVYDAVYPWETGGIQKRVWELSRRLANRHDVHWYGLRYWDGPSVIERNGVTLHGVADPPDLYVDGRRSISEALRFAGALIPELLSETFDIIDCQEFPYFPSFSAKLQSVVTNATLALTWHEVWGMYWYEYLGWKGIFGQAVERATARHPDIHVTVSGHTGRAVADLGVPDGKLRQLPNGVSMNEIAAAPEGEERIDVLFVGRLIAEKNAELVVKAIKTLHDRGHDIHGLLLGDGPERDRIETLVADYGLHDHVEMVRNVDEYERVLGLMKAAETFVLPSEREGFGITALEALACGTPVVTIAHPQNAVQELLDTETGVVCDPTPTAVADGILQARTDLAAERCRSAAEAYDWEQIADRAEALYQEVA